MSDVLLVRDEGAVRVLTLNRPHVLNAIDGVLGAALHQALAAADGESSVRCIVLTGAGGRAFSAGGDLRQMAATDGPDMGGGGRVITEALRYLPDKPVLGAANGLAYGGGLELLLACDLVVSGEHVTFALPEVSRGIVAAGGGLVNLPRLVGARRALQLVLTGTPIDAPTALDWGLVNEIVPPGTELERALALARTIADNAPVAVRWSKQTVVASLSAGYEDAWQASTDALAAVRRSPDALEGARAFAEKRAPIWTGLENC